MKKYFVFVLILFAAGAVFAADSRTDSSSKNASVDQARQDYREFAKQLKAVNEQYKQVTAEVSKVLKEEGFPTYDEDTGQFGWSHDLGDTKASEPLGINKTFGDVDIQETSDTMIVKMDLPGVKKDRIKISIENSKTLHVQGERKEESLVAREAPDSLYRKYERQRGAFERVIQLPAQAKDTGTDARYEDGVLTIKISKAPNAIKEVLVPVR